MSETKKGQRYRERKTLNMEEKIDVNGIGAKIP
jgi:hypothetical protein